MHRRRLLWFIGLLVVIIAAALLLHKAPATAPDPPTNANQAATVLAQSKPSTTPTPAPAFNKQRLSIDDPNSLWVIANKRRPLNPTTYQPEVAAPAMRLRLAASVPEMQVSRQMLADLQALDAASQAARLPLMLASGYRSYDTQVAVYGNEVKNYGQAQADRQSARPGHSEHQTGLAIDLAPVSGQCMIQECFGDLPEGQWLAAHAHEYGFVIRYPQGNEAITGYLYEPWHIRYVGKELAAEIHKKGNITLEEFFGLPAAPTYQ